MGKNLVVACGACSLISLISIILVAVSFQTLEPQEYGLLYSGLEKKVEDNFGTAYGSGNYFVGVGNGFIRYPATVETFEFGNEKVEGDTEEFVVVGPALNSRTKDGLSVQLQIAFQYQLDSLNLMDLYRTFGEDYRPLFRKVATSTLQITATNYTAQEFFANRTQIGPLMERALLEVFEARMRAELTGFQLRQVVLPAEFETAVSETQLQTQKINFVSATQRNIRVEKETELLKSKDQVQVKQNEAKAKAQQYLLDARSDANAKLVDAATQASEIRLTAVATAQNLGVRTKYEAAAKLAEAEAQARAIVLRAVAEAQGVKAEADAYVTTFNETKFREATSLKKSMDALGNNERKFLETIQIQELQKLNWEGMTINLNTVKSPYELLDV